MINLTKIYENITKLKAQKKKKKIMSILKKESNSAISLSFYFLSLLSSTTPILYPLKR